MQHDDLKLTTVSRMFEFEKISRELDTCTNIDILRNLCKCYVKLYMRQQEILIELGSPFDLNN
jgi:hypothetical protein